MREASIMVAALMIRSGMISSRRHGGLLDIIARKRPDRYPPG
jgi:hypothetical protein